MSAESTSRTSPAARLRRWLASWELKRWWQAAVVAVLAATALFGGLDTVDTAVTTFRPGEPFSDGEFTVTVNRASLVREVRNGTTILAPAKPGRSYLGVITTIRNDGTVPGRLDGEVDLVGLPEDRFVGPMRLQDGTSIPTLGPGLTEDVAFVWELPQDAVAVGDSVTVRIWKKHFGELMTVYGQDWVDSLTDYGQTTVTVGTKP